MIPFQQIQQTAGLLTCGAQSCQRLGKTGGLERRVGSRIGEGAVKRGKSNRFSRCNGERFNFLHDRRKMAQQMSYLTVRCIVITFAIIIVMVVMVQIIFMVMMIIIVDERCDSGFVMTVDHLPSETGRHERAD